MPAAQLEHVNVTVSDPVRTAQMLCDLFDWRIRWRGPAQSGGETIHVGTDSDYLAVYAPPGGGEQRHSKGHPLNHVGVAVVDLDAVEQRVRDAGLTPFGHGDYEPGRRFYFFDHDGIEFEVVSYG